MKNLSYNKTVYSVAAIVTIFLVFGSLLYSFTFAEGRSDAGTIGITGNSLHSRSDDTDNINIIDNEEGTLFTNRSRITISDNTVVGNRNTIHGDNNTIVGNRNTVYGDNNIIIGNRNTAYGENNTADGNRNNMW
jgi:hypothetical protein